MRQTTGFVTKYKGKWAARISYVGTDGKRKYKTKSATSKRHALELTYELVEEFRQPREPMPRTMNQYFNQIQQAREARKIAEVESERVFPPRIAAEPQSPSGCQGDSHGPGYVYLLAAEVVSAHKIGRSRDLRARVQSINSSLPFQVDVLHCILVEDMSCAELFLFDKFADRRINGEWFRLTPEDVRWLCAQTVLDY